MPFRIVKVGPRPVIWLSQVIHICPYKKCATSKDDEINMLTKNQEGKGFSASGWITDKGPLPYKERMLYYRQMVK